MTAQAPLDRLSPADFYRQLDWLRDEWGRRDVPEMMRKIVRLRKLYEHLPHRFYEQSLPIIATLKRYDDEPNTPYLARIRELVEIVRAWDRARPPLIACPECGIAIRGRSALSNHLLLVHAGEGRY